MLPKGDLFTVLFMCGRALVTLNSSIWQALPEHTKHLSFEQLGRSTPGGRPTQKFCASAELLCRRGAGTKVVRQCITCSLAGDAHETFALTGAWRKNFRPAHNLCAGGWGGRLEQKCCVSATLLRWRALSAIYLRQRQTVALEAPGAKVLRQRTAFVLMVAQRKSRVPTRSFWAGGGATVVRQSNTFVVMGAHRKNAPAHNCCASARAPAHLFALVSGGAPDAQVLRQRNADGRSARKFRANAKCLRWGRPA